MCCMCKPFCEICKVKYVICPRCGKPVPLQFDACLLCNEPISEQMKEARRAEWAAQHPKAQPSL